MERAAGAGATFWNGSFAGFAKIISGCSLYVGYDSAGQHIAAALGIPVIDIFTQSANPIFRERWRPSGSGIVNVVVAGPGDYDSPSWSADGKRIVYDYLAPGTSSRWDLWIVGADGKGNERLTRV